MNRREYLKAMTAFTTIGLLDKVTAADTKAPKPNILIIMTDEHRHDCLGCCGNKQIKTPNLDSLAADSVRYDNSFCSYPVCTPSRYSFISGLYVHQHRGYSNHCTLPLGTETIAGLFKQAGYQTTAVGKMHYTPTYFDVGFEKMFLAEQNGPGRWDDDYHRYLRKNGLVNKNDLTDQEGNYRKLADKEYWDSFGAQLSNLPDKHHSTTWIGNKAIDELKSWDSDKPNMMMVSFIKPHHPFDPPAKWARMYDPDQIDILPGWTDTCPDHDRKKGYFQNTDLTEKTLKKITAYYYATITHIDFHVGRMIDTLKKSGIYDNTIIVFTSDHGEHLGFHHMLLKGGHLYDSIAKVPLIIKYPDNIKSGTSTDKLVSNIDIAPTLLKLTGINVPTAMKGLDLLSNKSRVSVFVEGGPNTVMVRSHAIKMILQRKTSTDGSIDYSGYLFDLEKDPYELNSLWGHHNYSSQQATLISSIDSWLPASRKRNIYVDENAPIINQPNVPKRNDGHRDEIKEYFKKKMVTGK
ncbi:MAG: sulfatase-like hydrolase/transferase [Anaerohalosphaera sp.]|nr:sulfatase-like hydrolase/transferase [Anaerohalosphaera sp.]